MDLSTWVSDVELAGWVHDATDRLVASVADFEPDDDRWLGPYRPEVNPPI